MAKLTQNPKKFKKDEVRGALEAARIAADQALQDYLKDNTKWAQNLQGIKSRRDHQLHKLVVTD